MQEQNRVKAVYKNTFFTLAAYLLQTLLGFAVRKIFIDTLGIEYLGYNSVFSNILQMLNLADLGIGVAVTSFLFRPLAEGNTGHIRALMYIYKRVYRIIGLAVAAAGVIVSFFLPFIIRDAGCSDGYLRLLFYINLAGTVSTYFLAYKRTLIIADQKTYAAVRTDFAVSFLISVLQIVLLLIYPDYIIYLLLLAAKGIISNIIISAKCDKEYSYINEPVSTETAEEYKPQLFQFVKDVFISRIGAVIYYSTDNIIISAIKGSLLTGFLSNYTLITSQLTGIVQQILYSVQATFGNYLNSNNDAESQRKMTDAYLLVNYIIGNFCMICFLFLVQPFICLVFGKEYLLGTTTAVLLSVNLMLTIMLQLPSQLFTIYKLYRYDRVIIIISAASNIIISVAGVIKIGIDGALAGTLVTSLFYIFSRLYIVSEKVYRISVMHYLKKILCYSAVSAVSVLIVSLAVTRISGETVISFIVRGAAAALLSSALIVLFLGRTDEFRFLVKKFLK